MRIGPAFVVAVLGMSSCASAPPFPPNPEMAHLAITLNVRAPWSFFPEETTTVRFARLDPGQSDCLTRSGPIDSNFTTPTTVVDAWSGHTSYALKVEPGRYVAVIGGRAILPEDMIRMTDVTVEAGTMAFIGDYCVHTSPGLEDVDATQKFYGGVSLPGSESSDAASVFRDVLLSEGQARFWYRGVTEAARCDSKALEEFREEAPDDLVDAAWASIAQNARSRL